MARNSPYYCVDIKWRYPSVGYVLLDSPAKYGYGYPPAESFTDLVLRPSPPLLHQEAPLAVRQLQRLAYRLHRSRFYDRG